MCRSTPNRGHDRGSPTSLLTHGMRAPRPSAGHFLPLAAFAMTCMRLLAAAALLALCACAAAADPATATAVAARQRACRAALGVLRRCAFSSANREELRTRCCSLLDTFTANGCLW